MLHELTIVAVAASGLLASFTTTSAETITVCAKGCEYTSINDAIAVASDGDVIQLEAETYFEGEQIDTLGKAITLRGVLDKDGEPATTIESQVVCSSSETRETVISDLRLSGNLDVEGWQLVIEGSSPTIENCLIKGEVSGFGSSGAIVLDGSPIFKRCRFEDLYSAYTFTGIYSSGSFPVVVEQCTFLRNSRGAIHAESASISSCVFQGNRNSGGGQNVTITSGVIELCTFEENLLSDGAGAGVRVDAIGLVEIRDSVFRNNTQSFGDRYAGAIAIYSNAGAPSVQIFGCVFEGNSGSTNVPTDRGTISALAPFFMTNSVIDGCCQIVPPESLVDGGGNTFEPWCDDCRGNSSCVVDSLYGVGVYSSEIGYLLARWDTDDPQCDLDGDGVVGAADLGLLFAAWGPCR